MNYRTRVLCVDDEPINLQLLKITLGKKFNVITAGSTLEGLRILDENHDIAVVISDMKMPHMSGLEFIGVAKQRYPDVDYYILTGFDITDEIQQALDNGTMTKYFRRPFNLTEIELAIACALQGKGQT
ncbi:MAG: response regulator [Breznakibacter sp.]